MSDYDSSQPIRSEADGTDERVHVKIVDYSDPSGVDKQVEVSEKLVHIRAFGEDKNGTKRQLKLSESGKVNGDGEYDSANNTEPNSAGLIAHERNAAKDETHLTKRISAVDSTVDTTITALDVAIKDSNGDPITENNPIPVTFEESAGEEIFDFNGSATDVVRHGTDTHTYTVPTGKTLRLSQVMCTASGKAKFEIAVGAAGSEVTMGVRMVSSSNNNADWTLNTKSIHVASGENVKITRTNRDYQAQALYTTIVGVLV